MWRTAEAPILSPSDRNALPPQSQLERTALSLERKGNTRLLICVVERWAESGDPTPRAVLAQIRALLSLCVYDRAWARLQPLLDDQPSAEALRLAIRLLIDRGRTADAQVLIARGRERFPNDDAIAVLGTTADEPGTVIDVTDPLESDPDGQAQVAARLLRDGAHLRARRILERVRTNHPGHTRTADLLWALDGDFGLKGVSLADLARVHATPALLDIADASEDNTESVSAELLRSALGEDAPGAFPSLFKNLSESPEMLATDPPSENEVTLVSTADAVRAAIHQARSEDEEETAGPAREDTQIMHVVRKDPTQGPEGVDTLVDAPYTLNARAPVDGESEDEDVIVRRKVDAPSAKTEIETGRIQLDPARERVQSGANTADEAAEFMRPRKKRPPPVIEDAEERPALSAAPSKKPRAPSEAVTLERLPPSERKRVDPSAPTVILEQPAPERHTQGFNIYPWTGWLLVVALLALSGMAIAGLLLLAALTRS